MKYQKLFILVGVSLIILPACTLVSDFLPGPFIPAPSATVALVIPSSTSTVTNTPQTPTLFPPTPAPEPSATPEPPKPFAVLQGAPLFSPAFLHSDLDCAWMGVAGQAFGIDGEPLSNLVVTLTGTLAGSPVDLVGYTGAAAGYGPGGYEIKLSDQAQAGAFEIQLHDLEGKALSEPFEFAMSGACDQNLAIINFAQEGEYQLVLPLIIR